MDTKAIDRVQAHLRRTFAGGEISVKPRPKLKDSAEVYVGEEFVGVLYDDEDDPGSYRFEMPILGEDLG